MEEEKKNGVWRTMPSGARVFFENGKPHKRNIKKELKKQQERQKEKYDKIQRKLRKQFGLGVNTKNTVENHPQHKLLEQIDLNEDNINKTLNKYEKLIKNDKIENAIIITKEGKVYQCFGNKTNVWPDYDLKDELRGAVVTHNHVSTETNYGFSKSDTRLFKEYQLSRLRGIDDKYTYELNSNKGPVLNIPEDYQFKEYGYEHLMSIQYAIDNNIYYMRWNNE